MANTLGRPPIQDEFSDIPDRRLRWLKRNPEKAKRVNREAQRRYYKKKRLEVNIEGEA